MNECPLMTVEALNAFLEQEFPQLGNRLVVEKVKPNAAQTRMKIEYQDLRPGGTVSGPAMFTLADCAFYVVTLAMIGPRALTVTTSCSINFMRKPEPKDIVAEARILKRGRSLCVGDVLIRNCGETSVVAHASLTYAIPPK